MREFIPGQRWISDAELPMGLGTVLSVKDRMVTIVFLATGETRNYSMHTAPLTRVRFDKGDHIINHDQQVMVVQEVTESDGIISYIGVDDEGEAHIWSEADLNNFIQLNRPAERLFNGQIDQDRWFDLRYQTLQYVNRLAHSELYGLIGVRTSLIPHQLYIAHEVANRYSPRVLLADEVGLGKTIEAGMILHHQLLTERVRRVLIIVPESLTHQWLVEMLRRFNLMFSVFDEERCSSFDMMAADEDEVNPFLSEQLVLCSIDLLRSDERRYQQCLDAEWDLLVVDEAHHLEWHHDEVSEEYRIVEALSASIRGVLLLTATPEQLGKEGHFARLRLLDPARFSDYQRFIDEEAGYEPVADVIAELIDNEKLSDASIGLLGSTLDEGDNREHLTTVSAGKTGTAEDIHARQVLIEHLLDRHGTGRVLLRNTRSAIRGFPERRVIPTELPSPVEYADLEQEEGFSVDPAMLLTPEVLYRARSVSDDVWTRIDPRLPWLAERLNEDPGAKVLVIAAHRETVLDIAEVMRYEYGIPASVFHEGMSLVERDRAAAYFADHEEGSQVLICSEIGSEGRNFQFAHRMVLFDLPLNPDLLEQRIGRLDRIGQTQTIEILVPYLEGGAQAVLFDWYHRALNAFESTCPAGHSVFVEVQDELTNLLTGADDDVEAVIERSATLHAELEAAMHNGRDRLLEYNSCRIDEAQRLEQLAIDSGDEAELAEYMERVYDCLAIESEVYRESSLVLRPSDHMPHPMPGLSEDGMPLTYDRKTALANEDLHYFTWEHPFVRAAMDVILSNEQGNAAVTACRYQGAPSGSLLLECVFVLEAANDEVLQASRYLPPTTIRIVVDEKAKRHDTRLSPTMIARSRVRLDAGIANKVVEAKKAVMRVLIEKCERYVLDRTGELIADAHQQSRETLTLEVDRLRALAGVNPNVREEEIHFFERQRSALDAVIEDIKPRLDAVRAIVVM